MKKIILSLMIVNLISCAATKQAQDSISQTDDAIATANKKT